MHGVEVSNRQNGTEAVELSPIRFQIKIFQIGRPISCKVERPVLGHHAVRRVEAGQRFLQLREVFTREPAANVNVLGQQRHAVRDGGIATDHNKLHMVLDESRQQ